MFGIVWIGSAHALSLRADHDPPGAADHDRRRRYSLDGSSPLMIGWPTFGGTALRAEGGLPPFPPPLSGGVGGGAHACREREADASRTGDPRRRIAASLLDAGRHRQRAHAGTADQVRPPAR